MTLSFDIEKVEIVQSSINVWSDVFQAISALAALGAVLIAAYALKNWKREHVGKQQMQTAASVTSKIKPIKGYSCLFSAAIKQDSAPSYINSKKIGEYKNILNELEQIMRADISLYLGDIVEYKIIELVGLSHELISCVEGGLSSETWSFNQDEKEKYSAISVQINVKKEEIIRMLSRHIKDIDYKYTHQEKKDFDDSIVGTINEQ